MQLHNPQVSWPSLVITRSSEHCFHHCLCCPVLTITSTSVESPDLHPLVHIPEEYHEFMDVFSKTKVSGLPPHQPYDCTIDLLPGTTSAHSCVYPLSHAEQQAMEEYVQEVLQQGYLLTSLSWILFCGEENGQAASLY